MNWNKTLGTLLIFLIIFFSCSTNDNLLSNELIIYQEGNIKITLIEVNDGRCPTNAECIWQGNSEVKMKIVKENETMDFTLNTAGYINDQLNYPDSISIFNLNIKLLDVQPYPELDSAFSLEDYTISLNVN